MSIGVKIFFAGCVGAAGLMLLASHKAADDRVRYPNVTPSGPVDLATVINKVENLQAFLAIQPIIDTQVVGNYFYKDVYTYNGYWIVTRYYCSDTYCGADSFKKIQDVQVTHFPPPHLPTDVLAVDYTGLDHVCGHKPAFYWFDFNVGQSSIQCITTLPSII